MPNPLPNQIEKNLAEDNIIKDIRYLYRPKKKKDNDIKDDSLRDIRIMFEPDTEDCYEPIRIGNTFSSNYIVYESNGHCQLKNIL